MVCRALQTGLAFMVVVFLSTNMEVTASAQDAVFSGPQVGEKLPPFNVKGAVGEFAGKEYDPVTAADKKPVLLMFLHQRTRPAFGMCRAIAKYAESQKKNGLATHMILLTDDPSGEEKWAQNLVARYFPKEISVAVSGDGAEGPGTYGLNRNVTLTILVGKEGKVTGNFALVQPQLQADGPKVLEAVAAATGAKAVPTIAELDQRYAGRAGASDRMRNNAQRMKEQSPRSQASRDGGDPRLVGLIRTMLNKQATTEEVKQVAKRIEDYIATNDKAKVELKQRISRVVESGKLSNYGTEAAQKVFVEWVAKFKKEEAKQDDPEPQS